MTRIRQVVRRCECGRTLRYHCLDWDEVFSTYHQFHCTKVHHEFKEPR